MCEVLVDDGRVDDVAYPVFVAARQEDEVVWLESELGVCPGEGVYSSDVVLHC